MADLTITASDVHLITGSDEHQHTLPAGADITAGQMIQINSSTGKWALANGTTAAKATNVYMALNSAKSGLPVTGLKTPCLVALGEALASLNFGVAVYLSDTDGALADAAGTVSTVVGYVTPIFGETADRVLRLTQ